jgi:uncharacterized protein YbjT (DUF2867 family)
MTVLVAGASGTTGSEVLAQLVAAGVDVRAMSRSKEKAAALRGPGVEAVVATYDDPASLASAFEGVGAAYVVTSARSDMAEIEGAFARAAADAGAHLVKLSVVGADRGSPLRFNRAHAETEATIEALGGSWTFVRPGGFMQNDLAWAAQVPSGTIAGPVVDAAWSIVDVRDIAAVAVAALTDPATHAGRPITVTGPEPRTPRDRVAALAEILGRELTVVDVPIDAAKEQLRSYGLDDWTVDGLGELFAFYASGGAAGVSPDAEAVLGRPSRRWEDFAADHAPAFTG